MNINYFNGIKIMFYFYNFIILFILSEKVQLYSLLEEYKNDILENLWKMYYINYFLYFSKILLVIYTYNYIIKIIIL